MDRFKTGNLIRQLRLEHHYTQRTLSEKLNISHKDVQDWEDGRVFPSDEYLHQMAELFQVTYQELYQGFLEIPEDPFDVLTRNLGWRISIYAGLVFCLLGLSLFIFVHSTFVIHIFVVVVGVLLSRFILFKIQPKNTKRQYIIVTSLLVVLLVSLVVVNPDYYLVRREEHLRVMDYKEQLYLQELGHNTHIVTFHAQSDGLYGLLYREEASDLDIIYFTDYEHTDIFTIDTGDEVVLDAVFFNEKLYISMMTISSNTISYKLHELDPIDYSDTVIFESDEAYLLYRTFAGIYMVTHPIYAQDKAKIYLLDHLENITYLDRLGYNVWDMHEYTVLGQVMLLASVTTSTIVDGVQLQGVVILETNRFSVHKVLVNDLVMPLYFDGDDYFDVYGYNEDTVYRFFDEEAVQIKNFDGCLDFTYIDLNAFYCNKTFLDYEFNVIQKNGFYDEQFNRVPFSEKVVPDENGNFYILDNEFMGFGIIYPNEPYIWTIHLFWRISYAIASIISFGFLLRLGQKRYQEQQKIKQGEEVLLDDPI